MEANNNEDPFKVRLKFSAVDYVKMVVLGVTLLPLRLTGENVSMYLIQPNTCAWAFLLTIRVTPLNSCLGMVLCFLLAWMLSVIGMTGWDEEQPVTGWRKVLQNLVGVLGRMSMVFIGFHYVSYHGRQCTTEEAPILVVAPHTSFFDALVVFCSGFPYFINRIENKSLPLLGKCIQFRQAVFVSRDVADSRQRTVGEITRRVRWRLPFHSEE